MADGGMLVGPATLEGEVVRLEPLGPEHVEGLCAVAFDPDLWRWMPVVLRSRADVERFVGDALQGRASGVELPFATIVQGAGTVVGSTRYLAIAPAHRRLEIGWTWIARPWQRTAVNTEAKLLMLGHAFDGLGCHRVEFKTDALNAPSRAAILRLGAREEGTFRRHMVMPDGRLRDSAYYSIIDAEWPAVKAGLLARLGRTA